MPADPAEEALKKAVARSIASTGTWFVSEYPKLIIQSGSTSAGNTFKIYAATAPLDHLRGALSSAAQRGSSACIMFYGQFVVTEALGSPLKSDVANAGLAGFFSGGASSLIHTIFEPIKIRHEGFRFDVYSRALLPMFWRHALFDMSFFASNAAIQDQSHSVQFCLSALAASCANLTHDVWKTRLIKALPARLPYHVVLKEMMGREYFRQLAWKSVDLGTNWFATGALYSNLFQKK